MNEIVEMVYSLMNNNPRATLEPGMMKSYRDDKVQIRMDMFGSKTVRVRCLVTKQNVFLGNNNSVKLSIPGEWETHIENIIQGKTESDNAKEIASAQRLAEETAKRLKEMSSLTTQSSQEVTNEVVQTISSNETRSEPVDQPSQETVNQSPVY